MLVKENVEGSLNVRLNVGYKAGDCACEVSDSLHHLRYLYRHGIFVGSSVNDTLYGLCGWEVCYSLPYPHHSPQFSSSLYILSSDVSRGDQQCHFSSVTNYGTVLEERCRKARLNWNVPIFDTKTKREETANTLTFVTLCVVLEEVG